MDVLQIASIEVTYPTALSLNVVMNSLVYFAKTKQP